jgi:hypothetical protein
MGHVIARRIAKLPGGFELPAPAALVGILLLGGITKAGHGTWAIVAMAGLAAIYALALAAKRIVEPGH